MPFYDRPAQGEPQAGAGYIPGESLQRFKNQLLDSLRNAFAVVLHGKLPSALNRFRDDADHRRDSLAPKLDSVRDQVLKKLLQLDAVGFQRWQRIIADLRTGFGDERCQRVLNSLDHIAYRN